MILPLFPKVEPSVSYSVDFVNVSTVGLESSPVVAALAGLRANKARYFMNTYNHVFTVEPAANAKKDIGLGSLMDLAEDSALIRVPPHLRRASVKQGSFAPVVLS